MARLSVSKGGMSTLAAKVRLFGVFAALFAILGGCVPRKHPVKPDASTHIEEPTLMASGITCPVPGDCVGPGIAVNKLVPGTTGECLRTAADAAVWTGDCGTGGGGGSSGLAALPTLWLRAGVGLTLGSGGSWINQGSVGDTWPLTGVSSVITLSTLNAKPAVKFNQTSGGTNSGSFASGTNSAAYISNTAYTLGIVFQYADTNTHTELLHNSALLAETNLQWGGNLFINPNDSSGIGLQGIVNQGGIGAAGQTFPYVQSPSNTKASPHYLIAQYYNGFVTSQIDGANFTNASEANGPGLSGTLLVGSNFTSNLSQYGGTIAEIVVFPYPYSAASLGTYFSTEYSLPAPSQNFGNAYYGINGVTVDGGAIGLAKPNGDAGCVRQWEGNATGWVCNQPAGGVSSLATAGTGLSCTPSTGAVTCISSAVTSVVGTGGISCNETSGVVTCSGSGDAGGGGSGGVVTWVTDEDCDLTAQTTQTLTSDGTYTFCGQTWTKGNSSNEVTHAQITNGTGLTFTPNSSSDQGSSTFSLPYVRIPYSSYISGLTPDTPVRVSVAIASENSAANYDQTTFGTTLWSSAYANLYTADLNFGVISSPAVRGWGPQVTLSQVNILTSAAVLPTSNLVGVMTFPAGLIGGPVNAYSGAAYSGGWPSFSSLDFVSGPGLQTLSSSAQIGLGNATTGALGIGAANFFLGAQREGSGTSFATTISHIRIEHQAASSVTLVGSCLTNTWNLKSSNNPTITSDGAFTWNLNSTNYTWTKFNSSSDRIPATITAAGLTLAPNSGTFVYQGTFSTPGVRIPIPSLSSTWTPFTPVRIWVDVASNTASTNGDGANFGMTMLASGYTNALTANAVFGQNNGSQGAFFGLQQLHVQASSTTTPAPTFTSNRTVVLVFPNGIMGGNAYMLNGPGYNVGSAWPSSHSMLASMSPITTVVTGVDVATPATGAIGVDAANIYLASAGGGSTEIAIYDQLRLDVCPPFN